jgi:hypothetical protein
VLIVGGGVTYAEWQAREHAADEANAILQHLLFASDQLAPNEMDALWRLASTDDERVRDSFARQLLFSDAFAERFNRKPDPVARALAGLHATRAQRLGQEAISSSREGDPLPRQVAAINLGLLLAPPSVEVGSAILRLAPASAGNDEAQASLARLLDVLRRLEPGPAQAALEPMLTAMKGTTDPDALEALAQAVQALAAKHPDAQAQAALQPVLTAMKGTTDPNALAAPGARLSGTAIAVSATGTVS